MSVKVKCFGAMADTYPVTELYASTPLEVIDLMELNYPGFKRELAARDYSMVLFDDKMDEEHQVVSVTKERAGMPMSDEQAFFIPRFTGEAAEGTAWAIWQVSAYLTVSVATATVIVYTAEAIILALLLKSLADWLSPNNPSASGEAAVFDGPLNIVRQGNVVPVCYGGPIRVGSQVISVSTRSNEVVTTAPII